MSDHTVLPGQVYVSCDPRDTVPIKVRVVEVVGDRARVISAYTGKQPRSILLSSFHAEATNPRTGRARRTGYRLVKNGGRADG